MDQAEARGEELDVTAFSYSIGVELPAATGLCVHVRLERFEYDLKVRNILLISQP